MFLFYLCIFVALLGSRPMHFIGPILGPKPRPFRRFEVNKGRKFAARPSRPKTRPQTGLHSRGPFPARPTSPSREISMPPAHTSCALKAVPAFLHADIGAHAWPTPVATTPCTKQASLQHWPAWPSPMLVPAATSPHAQCTAHSTSPPAWFSFPPCTHSHLAKLKHTLPEALLKHKGLLPITAWVQTTSKVSFKEGHQKDVMQAC